MYENSPISVKTTLYCTKRALSHDDIHRSLYDMITQKELCMKTALYQYKNLCIVPKEPYHMMTYIDPYMT